MIVVTRAQAKKQLEELIRSEQVLSGAQPSPVEGLTQSHEETSHTDTPQKLSQIPLSLTQEQRRSLRQQMGKQDPSSGDKKSVADTLELSAG